MTWALLLAATLIAPNDAVLVLDDPSRDDLQAQVERGLIPQVWVEGETWSIRDRMRALRVPGVSVAVYRDFEIEWAAGYGVRDADTGEPVTVDTLFQAGSISKPVAAMTALSMARAGLLDLDADVRSSLRSWNLPRTGYDDDRPLTLRDILSHSGSVTVHGFAGYGSYAEVPSAVEVLTGGAGVNSEPVTLDGTPGRAFRYAGGGTTIGQVIMTDVAKTAFPDLVRARVLLPIGMTRSTYAQPLPIDLWPDHSAGHLQDGSVQPGRFRVHPEMAAAGLWTTPTDLCRFAIALSSAIRGESETVLDQAWAEQMVTPIHSGVALGWFIEERAGEPYFQHGGSNIGFKNQLYAHRTDGYGVAVMTNGENGGQLMMEILNAVALAYGWEGFAPPPVAAQPIDQEQCELASGRYELGQDDVVVVRQDGDQLYARHLPDAEVRLLRTTDEDVRFFAYGTGQTLVFDEESDDGFAEVYLKNRGATSYGERMEDDTRHPIEDLCDGDLAAAIAAYRAMKEEDPNEYLLSDARLNQLAIDLRNNGSLDAAIAVARLNAEFHPESANSLDTLAQFLVQAGHRAEAIQFYRKSIAALAKIPAQEGAHRWLRTEIPSLLKYLEEPGQDG